MLLHTLPQSCLTIGEQGDQGPSSGSSRGLRGTSAPIRCLRGARVLTPLRLVLTTLCQVGALHPFHRRNAHPFFTHSVFVESALERQSWPERSCTLGGILGSRGELPTTLASIIHEPRWTVPTLKPGESLPSPWVLGPVRGGPRQCIL